jgi:hypothetical protein
MARRFQKSFTEPDLLKALQRPVLLLIVRPAAEVLAEKGFTLPEANESLDYRALAASLAEPDSRINDLAEALFLIRNVGVDERFDELREVAGNLNVRIDPLDSVADIAARIYLAEPQALIRLDRANLYRRRRRFESFVTRDACQLSPEQMLTDVSGLEGELSDWFVSTKRGRRCTVTRIACPGELRFLVQHGEPYTRRASCDDDHSGAVFYRPEQTDFVAFDFTYNELRINARHIREVKVYRRLFSLHLFDDEGFLVYAEKYTLEPLRSHGRAALEWRDIDGVEEVALEELECFWPGPYSHRDRTYATDVLAALSHRWRSVRATAELRMAKFGIKLRGERDPRSLRIKPRNVAEYSHGEEGEVIEEWMRHRGFIRIGAAAIDDETEAFVERA